MPGPGRRYQKGESGNRNGRPSGRDDFLAACRKRVPAALQALDEALKEPARALKAAEIILGYAHGRPTQPFAGSADHPPLGVELGGSVETVHVYIPVNGRELPGTVLVPDPGWAPPQPEAKPPIEPEPEVKPVAPEPELELEFAQPARRFRREI